MIQSLSQLWKPYWRFFFKGGVQLPALAKFPFNQHFINLHTPFIFVCWHVVSYVPEYSFTCSRAVQYLELGFQVTVFVSSSRLVLVKCCKGTKLTSIRIVKPKVCFQVCFQSLHSNISGITIAGELLLVRKLLVTLRGSSGLILAE